MWAGQGACRLGQADRRRTDWHGALRSCHDGPSQGGAGMSEVKFEGQVALVTGASRGIGAAIALELARLGLKVIGTATTDEGAARISATLAAHAGCRGAKLDVNDAAAGE